MCLSLISVYEFYLFRFQFLKVYKKVNYLNLLLTESISSPVRHIHVVPWNWQQVDRTSALRIAENSSITLIPVHAIISILASLPLGSTGFVEIAHNDLGLREAVGVTVRPGVGEGVTDSLQAAVLL